MNTQSEQNEENNDLVCTLDENKNRKKDSDVNRELEEKKTKFIKEVSDRCRERTNEHQVIKCDFRYNDLNS